MEVRLVSSDPDLCKLCRETLADIPGHSWTLTTTKVVDGHATSDLCLWDFHPNLLLPSQIDGSLSRHLFLVHKKDLIEFRKGTRVEEGNILLKPVSRATLAAFLGLAIAAHEERVSEAHSLRADRDEMLQCLIETNLRLQEYDQDRTNFLARAVHDFRAPLTAISGYCGLLLSEPFGALNENQREVLQRMLHSTKRLSQMASAMFQLSVGRQVKRQPDLQPADLKQCLEQALHEIAPFAREKRISISSDLAACDHKLYFEPGPVEQVLINILDNACKFTPKQGTIEISGYPYFWERRRSFSAIPRDLERRRNAAVEPNTYRVDIRDSGARIPTEHLHRIFEEYTSYAGGRDRSGGGLGLAICKMIVAQHDGHVWAENTETGPMFSIVLPTHRMEPTWAREEDQKLELSEF